jgi:peptidylprolyl isomerase
MRTAIIAAALLAAPVLAAETAATYPPTPSEIVAAAAQSDWVAIDPNDLLVMTLAPDAAGRERKVVIQLISAPFSQPWTANIRTLAKAHWWDGLAIVRAQDNYVVQWGDPDGEDKAKARALPAGLQPTSEADYTARIAAVPLPKDAPPPIRSCVAGKPCGPSEQEARYEARATLLAKALERDPYASRTTFRGGWPIAGLSIRPLGFPDSYAPMVGHSAGWPVAYDPEHGEAWLTHCYGSVGVGRDLAPDTGSGGELYAVIGHAPRHLDRNIAVVGRVIEGIEHLSTLPRGTEALGFYATPAERTPIASVRLVSDVPTAEQPRFEYLSTESDSFARYANARANRHDTFFIKPAGGVDVCNVPVPVRRVPAG